MSEDKVMGRLLYISYCKATGFSVPGQTLEKSWDLNPRMHSGWVSAAVALKNHLDNTCNCKSGGASCRPSDAAPVN